MTDPTTHVAIDWNAPLDVAASLARIPPEAEVRGLFFDDLLRRCASAKVAPPPSIPSRLVGFKMYPLVTYATACIDTARLVTPELPVREGLRRIGHGAYGAFADSLVGRVVFGALGRDFMAIVKICAKGYELSVSHGRATCVDVKPGRAVVRVDDMVNLFDSLQVGVFEGAMQVCHVKGDVKLWLETPVSGEMLVTWEV